MVARIAPPILLSTLLVAGACSPRAVTPPGRTMALASPTAPTVGHTDVQLGVARIGAVWGPELVGADARLRHTVRPGVVVEVDGGALHLLNEGLGGSREALTGRVGVLLTPRAGNDAPLRAALQLGAGGGTAPAAGDWANVDAGLLLSGRHRWIRPLAGLGLGLSHAVSDQDFTVATADGKPYTLRLPDNVTAQISAGVELGRPDRSLLLGGTVTHFWLDRTSVVAPVESQPASTDAFFALGLAGRITID